MLAKGAILGNKQLGAPVYNFYRETSLSQNVGDREITTYIPTGAKYCEETTIFDPFIIVLMLNSTSTSALQPALHLKDNTSSAFNTTSTNPTDNISKIMSLNSQRLPTHWPTDLPKFKKGPTTPLSPKQPSRKPSVKEAKRDTEVAQEIRHQQQQQSAIRRLLPRPQGGRKENKREQAP